MRLIELIREAAVAARSQRVPTIMVAVLVGAMCATTLLTVGRAAVAEREVAERLEQAGSRHLTVTDVKDRGFITPAAIAAVASVSTAELVLAVASPTDVTSGSRQGAGPKVSAWPVVHGLSGAVQLTRGRWPEPGEAIASESAITSLGLDVPAGFVETNGGAQFPVVGAYALTGPFASLEDAVLVDAPDATARTLEVIAVSAASAPETQRAVLQILARTDPTDLQVESPLALAQVQAGVSGDVGRFGRGLFLLVLLAGAVLVAVVVLADVLIGRRDLGRRRALGAGRGTIVGFVVLRTAFASIVGASVATMATAAVLAYQGETPSGSFAASTGILAVITACFAGLVPALLAAQQDPVRVLRTP